MAVDSLGNVYICENIATNATKDGNRIRKVSPNGIIFTIAGNGSFSYSGMERSRPLRN